MSVHRLTVSEVANTFAFTQFVAMHPCDQCGDDIGVHEWLDVDFATDTVVECDRSSFDNYAARMEANPPNVVLATDIDRAEWAPGESTE